MRQAAGQNLATGVYRDELGPVVLVVQNRARPSDLEWDAYVENIRACVPAATATAIAFTDGGTPNALQRGQVNDVLAHRQGQPARSAVISSNLAVRGIVTALRWFNPDTAVFTPRNIVAALSFANIAGERIDPIWAFIGELHRSVASKCLAVAEADTVLKGFRYGRGGLPG